MRYRREIDGLRALAVFPVILFHAGFNAFSGGFLGVDVFFVISGYLITSLLVAEIKGGDFSLINFYERRARRILPALFLTMLVTVVLAPFFLIPSQIKDVGQSLVATSVFFSNYFFYLETDYFNPFTNHAPLLHTWSLAVEEQFYIFFPILLLLFNKFRIKSLLVVFVLLLIVSFSASIDLITRDKSLAFYSIHTRAWELMVGSILAVTAPRIDMLISNFPKNVVKNFADATSLISILLIFYSFIFFSQSTEHPAFPTLIPVLGAGFLIFSTQYADVFKRILSSRILVQTGLISYGLYLYHNPIFSYIDAYFEDSQTLAFYSKCFSIPLVYAFSYLSYTFIEKPIRNRTSVTRQNVGFMTIAFFVTFVPIGYFIHAKNGFQQFFVEKFVASGGLSLVDVDFERNLVNKTKAELFPYDKPFSCFNGCERVLVLGDSFAEDAYLSLVSLRNPKVEVRKIELDDECMGGVNLAKLISVCNGKEIDLSLSSQATKIVISAQWQATTYANGFSLAKKLLDSGSVDVFVVGSVLFTDLSSMSLKLAKSNIKPNDASHLIYRTLRWERLAESDKLKRIVLDNKQLKWIGKYEFFCNSLEQRCDLFDAEGHPLIWDNAHLTTRAYERFGRYLSAFIFDNLSLELKKVSQSQ
jgi:peptidoglycan/LPS O-acetylase OafA/YrhL